MPYKTFKTLLPVFNRRLALAFADQCKFQCGQVEGGPGGSGGEKAESGKQGSDLAVMPNPNLVSSDLGHLWRCSIIVVQQQPQYFCWIQRRKVRQVCELLCTLFIQKQYIKTGGWLAVQPI